MDQQRRRELGAWYTPAALVDAVVAAALDGWSPPRGRPVTVLDPACGDGRFLAATAVALRAAGAEVRLAGVDVDPAAVTAAREALEPWDATVVKADALAGRASGRRRAVLRRFTEHVAPGNGFDLVVGNPPFLSPLAARNGRVATSSPAGSPYADAATQFLLLAWEALAAGGRVGFVLPQSVLANRDAAVAREAIADSLRWLWWSPRSVFEASVRTCAIVAERRDPTPDAGDRFSARVRRQVGPEFAAATDAAPVGGQWSVLLADLGGVPSVDGITTAGAVGDHATAVAGFRDEFYGVAVAVGDDVDGPPLVTSGLIDPARCLWGERPVSVARRRFDAPRVDLDRLPPRVRRWADRQLVPKVLVASQTKVLEAVADPAGDWIPGVPVVSVIPRNSGIVDVWQVAAVLTNPVASAAVARGAAGTGMSANTFRVTARSIEASPWPRGSLSEAVARLRAGDLHGCGREVLEAFGVDPSGTEGSALLAWWLARSARLTGVSRR